MYSICFVLSINHFSNILSSIIYLRSGGVACFSFLCFQRKCCFEYSCIFFKIWNQVWSWWLCMNKILMFSSGASIFFMVIHLQTLGIVEHQCRMTLAITVELMLWKVTLHILYYFMNDEIIWHSQFDVTDVAGPSHIDEEHMQATVLVHDWFGPPFRNYNSSGIFRIVKLLMWSAIW